MWHIPSPRPPPAFARHVDENGGSGGGRKGASRLHHSTTFAFQRSHAGETLLFVLAILDSATSAHGGSEGTKRSVSFASQHHFCVSAFSCRRQLPPLGRRGELVGRDSINALFGCEIQYNTRQRGRGVIPPTSPAPGPDPPFFRTRAAYWGVRGGAGVWRDFVVCLPASRALLRAAGWHSASQGGRAQFLAAQFP